MRNKGTFNRLYLQISAIFLLVLMLFASITLIISVNASRDYSIEVNQKLNRELAASTVNVVISFFKNGEINKEAIQDIIHSMMVINPSVEVYILDAGGNILTFVAPDSVVQMERVDLDPIIQFIDHPDKGIILGDDPRNPGESTIFSAARIFEGEKLAGYIYIVLASQEYISAAEMVLGSYILGISIRSIIAVMVVTAIVGLLAIWLITKRLNVVIRGIRQFQSGDLSARIPAKYENEFGGIGTVFNHMAEEIQKNIKDLKDLDTLRKELISNISHDLRTPVASIQGYAETLIMKKDTITKDEREKYLNIIVRSCERLKNQVADLFELSKLQAGQVDLQPEPFSIAELVQDVVNKYRILSQKKGININVLFSKDIPLVEADLSLIDRALQNLLDNAIKFCRDGDTINIEINTKSPGEVELRISDSGVGISQDDLPYIFERYFKNLDHEESTGLGLAIVKRIIDLHDSHIEVFSQPGKGTTFAFSLPMADTA
jgi:signal transduction histidine kinase